MRTMFLIRKSMSPVSIIQSTSAARQRAAPVVAYRRDKTVGTHPPSLSGLNTGNVGSTRYLCTSPAHQPTHRLVCYQPRRKARYWARGARLPRRDSHPLEHATLPGRTCPPVSPPSGFPPGFPARSRVDDRRGSGAFLGTGRGPDAAGSGGPDRPMLVAQIREA
jgi:hypothetical protein